jgi:response regulator RpfG family c-di-GMP phosphodiesterase
MSLLLYLEVMHYPEALLAEDRSRFTIMVVEDRPEFWANAIEALIGENIIVATSLEDANDVLRERDVDYILSDVSFPDRRGGKARENTKSILFAALKENIPVCFVSRKESNGLNGTITKGHIAISALNTEDVFNSLLKIDSLEKDVFSRLEASARGLVQAESKSIQVWRQAFDMLRIASVKTSNIARALERGRRMGVKITVRDGLPMITAPISR